MGTNYYLHESCCPHCGRAESVTHIGKSSAGWCFRLHVTGDLKSLDDWKLVFAREGNRIENEYGHSVSVEEMLRIITERKWEGGRDTVFHRMNSSEDGPNGLARSRVDGWRCVGHGEGTWDLIGGDFS